MITAFHGLLKSLPRDLTIIIIEHDMDLALDIADRITVMNYGEVVFEGDVGANPGQRAGQRHLSRRGRRPMLEIQAARGRLWRNRSVVHGLAYESAPGRCWRILGRNGVGKPTTLKAIMGLVQARRAPSVSAATLSAGAGAFTGSPGAASPMCRRRAISSPRSPCARIWTWRRGSPDGERRAAGPSSACSTSFRRSASGSAMAATQLSGGEQQMLAIGRALAMNPRLLILDEPTEGLAPIIIRQIHDKLSELRAEGMTMVLVEQNFGFATSLADARLHHRTRRLCVERHGRGHSRRSRRAIAVARRLK